MWGYILYSSRDILEFLSFKENSKVEIYKIREDLHTDFVIVFQDKETSKEYEKFSLNQGNNTYFLVPSLLDFYEKSNFTELRERLNETKLFTKRI